MSTSFGRLQTDWDVIVELARLEGFDVFMRIPTLGQLSEALLGLGKSRNLVGSFGLA